MSESFDLDAAVGTATADPFRFTWGGKAFEMPRVLDLPIDRQLAIVEAIDGFTAGEDLDASKLLSLLRLIVGDVLLEELSAAKPLSAVGVMKLLEAWMAHQSDTLGKSGASSASSNGTAARSKSTSPSGPARGTS